MGMRSPTSLPEMPLGEAVSLSQAEGEDISSVEIPDAFDDATVTAVLDLAMPDVMRFGQDRPDGFSHCLVDPVTRSWARAEMSHDQATVHQSGQRRMWEEVEHLCGLWLDACRPRHEQLGLTVDPNGTHHLWTGSPDHRLMVLPVVSRFGAA
jgi:hypothetical protein